MSASAPKAVPATPDLDPVTEVVPLRHGLTAVLVLHPTCPQRRRPCSGCPNEQRNRCLRTGYFDAETVR